MEWLNKWWNCLLWSGIDSSICWLVGYSFRYVFQFHSINCFIGFIIECISFPFVSEAQRKGRNKLRNELLSSAHTIIYRNLILIKEWMRLTPAWNELIKINWDSAERKEATKWSEVDCSAAAAGAPSFINSIRFSLFVSEFLYACRSGFIYFIKLIHSSVSGIHQLNKIKWRWLRL